METEFFLVLVAYADAPRSVRTYPVSVPKGATVEQAIAASAALKGAALQAVQELELSIWGRKTTLGHRVREGDRIELTRPLLVDPKMARRERFARQGARTTGLFAKKKAVEK